MEVQLIQPLHVRRQPPKLAIGRLVDLPDIPIVGDFAHDAFMAPTLIEKVRVNLDTKNYECILTFREFESGKDVTEFTNDIMDCKNDPDKTDTGWSIICANK